MAITLSAGVRQNLLSLQNTADMMATTQNRLATGKKVNSALDNPSAFFTSSSLQSRASDMSSLLDSMSNGVKTLEAADNGLKSITKTLESMQSTLRQARQDKSFQTASYSLPTAAAAVSQDIELSGGAVGTTPVKVNLASTAKTTAAVVPTVLVGDNAKTFTVANNGVTTGDIALATGDTVDAIVTKINTAITTANGANAASAADTDVVAKNDGGKITLTSAKGGAIAVADGSVAGGAAVLGFGADVATAKSVDSLVSEINANTSLAGKVRAANDNGKLRLENQSTQKLNLVGANGATGALDGAAGTAEIGGNKVRAGLADQFNELKDQLDKLSDDASYNGINLLRGDKLKITFNETGTSTIDIQTEGGKTVNSAYLAVSEIKAVDLDSDDGIDDMLDTVKGALNTISSQSSTFGSNLSIVQNRQDFTSNMITTLQTGADSLVLADTNAEAANMLALQTRQQLASTALSMASQSDQAALRLF